MLKGTYQMLNGLQVSCVLLRSATYMYIATLSLGKPCSLSVLGVHSSPITDNLLFLNQQKREAVSKQESIWDKIFLTTP